jgi:uracil phosphoribosyltransferase
MSIKTGCYLDHHRHSAIVVRVKDGTVTYLTMNVTKPSHYQGQISYETTAQKVSLCSASDSAFAKQYEIYMPSYPVLRAAEIFWRSGLEVTPEAAKVIHILLKANKTRAPQ